MNDANLNMSHSNDVDGVSGQLICRCSLRKIDDMPESEPEREPTPFPQSASPVPVLDDHLAFDYHLFCARFADLGRYYLHLSLRTSSDDKYYSGIVLEENDDGKYRREHEANTETVTQPVDLQDYIYLGEKWTFYIPRGN